MFNKGERKLSFFTLLCAIKATDSTLFSTELRAKKATKSFAFLRTCVQQRRHKAMYLSLLYVGHVKNSAESSRSYKESSLSWILIFLFTVS
jgi:hypothetical protein